VHFCCMEKKFLSIRNASKNETVIDIDGEIGPYVDWAEWRVVYDNTYKALKGKLAEIPQSSAQTITVNINSLGGYLNDGLSMLDLLSEHKAKVITVVRGFTASAATVIAQAASKGNRRMSSNAFYLIHKGMTGIYGNANEIRSVLEDMEGIDEKLAELYSNRSGKEIQDFRDLMDKNNGNGVWLSASEALEYGLVDEVYEPNDKAVSLERVQNFYSNEKNLPPLPQVINNSPDMTLEEKFSKFKNEVLEAIKNIGKGPANAGEGADNTVEVKILDNEEVTNMIAGMEDQIKNAVSQEDHDAVVNAKNELETEKANWSTEKTGLENKVSNLETELAKLKGTKTTPAGGGDPNPSGGPTSKTQNEINAEANAKALRGA